MALKSADLSSLPPLHVANAVMDDPVALNRMWDEDGYLFFRDVIDKEAIVGLVKVYMDALIGLGVVDADATSPIWNGKNIHEFPFKIEHIEKSKIWESFARQPSVRAMASRVFQADPYFLPMTEYRVTPPGPPNEGDALLFRHQDAFLNAGIPFRVFWIPISDIDARAGGLVIAEGWHKRGFVHDPNDYPKYAIPAETIPDSAWRRSDYHPGDVLVFNVMTPHSGAWNCSGTFRCSMDLRVMKSSDTRPIIGAVADVEVDSISIRDEKNTVTRLKVAETSMIRGANRMPVSSRAAMQVELPLGTRVIAGHADGVITCIRPER